MTDFSQERLATVQFSDTFGSIPLKADQSGEVAVDFDADLTAQVRNTGKWQDARYGIGAWPSLGHHAAVLLEDLRQGQIDQAEELGITTEDTNNPDLHPDERALAASLGGVVVGVINAAARTEVHRENGRNGSDFYVGATDAGNEIFAQLPYFRGLNARGVLRSLHRIPEEAGVWQPGEQFRSSVVSQARRKPEVLEPVDLSIVPDLDLDGRLAYVDTFGNSLIEVANAKDTQAILASGEQLELAIGDGEYGRLAVHAVRRLIDIPEGQLGVYINPTARPTDGPGYLEVVRRVSRVQGNTWHAYRALSHQVASKRPGFGAEDWSKINISLGVA